MLATGSNRVTVVLRNNTRDWLEIGKGMPVTRMVAANQVPQVIDTISALTVKDSHPLPCICETLESLAGAAHYLTFDLNSGFWQVPMDEESKQYTALHWAAWVCMSAKVCLLGCVTPHLLSKGSCKTVWAN